MTKAKGQKKMNKEAVNKTPSRPPITERGVDLLKTLYQEGGLYLTQEEGQDIVQNGFAQVLDWNNKDGYGNVRVTISELGLSQLGINSKGNSMDTNTKAKFAVSDYCPPVEKKARGARSGSMYPFDALNVGQSFHVPATAKMPDPVKSVSSAVVVANRRFSVGAVDANGNPVMETVKEKTYQKGADGKRAKDAEGKLILESVCTVEKQKLKQTRNFVVQAALADDPAGAGARVIRTA